jgi:hypothetical protein
MRGGKGFTKDFQLGDIQTCYDYVCLELIRLDTPVHEYTTRLELVLDPIARQQP